MSAPMVQPAGTHDREWHEERLEGIGGSQAPILLGLSSFMSGAELSDQKIRRIIPDESNPTERDLRRRLGNMLEPVIADLYEETKHRALRRSHITLWHDSLPAFAHADGFAPKVPYAMVQEPDDDETVLVEMKTRDFDSGGWGEPDGGWTADDRERIPRDVFVQVQHDLMVSGRRVAHVAALFGLRRFRVYRIPADPATFADFAAVYPEFWRVVEEGRAALALGEEPVLWPVDGSPASEEYVKRRHPKGDAGRTILPSDAQEADLRKLLTAYEAQGRAKKAYEAARVSVMDWMGDAVAVSCPAGSVVWTVAEPKESLDLTALVARYERDLEPSLIAEAHAAATATEQGSRRFLPRLAKEKA